MARPDRPKRPLTPEERESIGRKLRTAAFGALAVGGLLLLVGLYDAVTTSERRMLWMILTGIPMLAVGGRMLQLSREAGHGRQAL